MSNPPSLHQYIEENEKLLNSLGIFTALTIFARSSIDGFFGNLLSILFLTLSLIIWLELVGRFPSKMGTSRMYWFESVLSITQIFLSVYWLVTFRKVFSWITFVLVFIAYSSLISSIMKKYDLFNRLFKAEPDGKKALRYILGIFLIIIGGAISLLIFIVTSHYFDKLLDLIDIELLNGQFSP